MFRIILSLVVVFSISARASVTVSNVTVALRPYSSVLDGWSNASEYENGTDPLSDAHFTLVGHHPVAARSEHKDIHVIHPWNGRLYMGVGNWNDRPGPIPLVSYEPVEHRFVVEHSLGTDSVGLFREIGNRLYVPSIDPAHFREGTDYAFSDGTNWSDHTSLGYYHVFGLATLTGSDLWAAGSKSAIEGAPGGAALSRSMDGGRTWTDFTPANSYFRFYWMFIYEGKVHVQGQYFDGESWQPSSLSETYFNKATVVGGAGGDIVIGSTGRGPGSVSYAINLVRFDGEISSIILSGAYDFTVFSNSVYAIQYVNGDPEILVCHDVSQPVPVWSSVGLQAIPPDSSSLAVMDGSVYLGTASGALYAAPLTSGSLTVSTNTPDLSIEQPDRFGASLATDGEWLAVGAPHTAGQYPENGSVYLFRDVAGTGGWVNDSKLMAPQSAQSDGRFFGMSVAMDDGLLAVAETGTPSTGPNRGEFSRVFLYELQGESWALVQQLTNAYVQSVCLDDGWLVLGAKDFAEIYRWNGSSFMQHQNIPLSVSGLTWSLVQAEISNSRLYVGVAGDVTLSSGGAGVIQEYGLNESEVWDYIRTLDQRSETTADGFARALSASGSELAIGAPRDDEHEKQAGAAYLYNAQSAELAKIISPVPAYAQGFGESVLLDGDNLFVGATAATNANGYGAVYHYYRLGQDWHYYKTIEPGDSVHNRFGAGMRMTGDSMLVGSYESDTSSNQIDRLSLVSFASVDADALPDIWEEFYFGHPTNSSVNGDADNDGESNQREFIAGTDPTNAASRFSVSVGSTNSNEVQEFVINWESVPERVYNVHWTPSLHEPFQLLENDIQYPLNSFTDAVRGAESGGFYKVDVRKK